MKTTTVCLTLALTLTVAALLTAGGVPTRVHYISHDKVEATFAKPAGDRTRQPLIAEEGLGVVASRRTAGVPEQHDKTTHLFIITEGEATLVTGGTIVGAKQPSPGQIRGTSIDGGQVHHMTKGDVIAIPANTPHWWKEVQSNTITFYGVNSEK